MQVEPEEIPKTDAVSYILEAAAQIYDKQNPGLLSKTHEETVIFCIDISGSMCVSMPVQGQYQLKGDKSSNVKKDLAKFGDGSD